MSNLTDNIKHIVFLMLENRSFDNLLAWCYDGASFPHVNNIPPRPGTRFFGLESPLLSEFQQPLHWNGGKASFHLVRGVGENHFPNLTPVVDPQESFTQVTQQLFGPDARD